MIQPLGGWPLGRPFRLSGRERAFRAATPAFVPTFFILRCAHPAHAHLSRRPLA
jgi:hypothetical protein